ncbi:dolichyl pyrophosphate glc1man9 c2 alpha-glucosyltransferase [Nannochloropsis oceanica]
MPSTSYPYAAILVSLFFGTTAIKLLLHPSYLSTDFEVHRNWLALTHSLPLREWYFEHTSEWTLDYPPFFAYFEWWLSQVAAFLNWDPKMLEISATPYVSEATILFQRLSVMVTDVVLLAGLALWVHSIRPKIRTPQRVVALGLVVLGSVGLLMVDHMHFQYNGMMIGLLFLSIAALRHGWVLTGAALFAALLMFKHLFLSLAPAYFVYLLSSYCFVRTSTSSSSSSATTTTTTKSYFSLLRFLILGLTVLFIFSFALGPLGPFSFPLPSSSFSSSSSSLLPTSYLQQLASRLFPFGRGLTHAYWAPNVWALYCCKDLALASLSRRLNLPLHDPARPPSLPSWTSGLVQVIEPEILFRVSPSMTACLVLVSICPALWQLWRKPTERTFLVVLFQTSLCGFMLGWHVHEKAVLVPVLLSGVLALSYQDRRYGRMFYYLSCIGHASLLPLFPPLTADALTAFMLIQVHVVGAWVLLEGEGLVGGRREGGWVEGAYLVGVEAMLWMVAVGHPLVGAERFPFGARLLSSVYCGVGMVGVWLWSFRLLVVEGEGEEEGEEEEEEEEGEGRGLTGRRRGDMRLRKSD